MKVTDSESLSQHFLLMNLMNYTLRLFLIENHLFFEHLYVWVTVELYLKRLLKEIISFVKVSFESYMFWKFKSTFYFNESDELYSATFLNHLFFRFSSKFNSTLNIDLQDLEIIVHSSRATHIVLPTDTHPQTFKIRPKWVQVEHFK